ncbi:MAG TPA: sigma-70 family RNA polymerase sigma factor [Blastocatellia bacterium]|nr:sigma-70 family RNA polymerase sigma factor [Blastocatellia bacterium]
MELPQTHDVTRLLKAWSQGDQGALDQLIPLVYAELHRLAAHYMHQERPGHLLQTTALVNEAYLRLADCQHLDWQNRAHFFGVAANLMRHILVDFARSRAYQKRGGNAVQVSLAEAENIAQLQGMDVVAIDEALQKLSALDERQGKVVEMRFFGGMSMEEIAEVLRVSLGTIKRDWSLAKLWLLRELAM